MEVLHRTPFEAAALSTLDANGFVRQVVVLKATYAIHAAASLTLAEKQAAILMADEYSGESGESSLLHENDCVYFKPVADILVSGHAVAPAGPTPSFLCELDVEGHLHRKVIVFGERRWRSLGLTDARLTAPLPVQQVPLCWERAYGGRCPGSSHNNDDHDPRNPVGSGFCADASALDGLVAPNFESLDAPVRVWRDRPPPQGFGPLGRGWLERRQFAGTFDERWSEMRAPLLPTDFDPLFFNAAPREQRSRGYLRGGERILARGFTANGAIAVQLPSLHPAVRVIERGRLRSLGMNLDTLHLDFDGLRVILTWRTSYIVGLNEPERPIRLDIPDLR